MLQRKTQWWAHSEVLGKGGPFLTVEDAWSWVLCKEVPDASDRVWCTQESTEVSLVPEIKSGKVPPYRVVPRKRNYHVGAQ